MIHHELTIEGMSCNHCVTTLRKHLAVIPDLSIDDVRVGWARVRYDDTSVRPEELEHAVAGAGFKLMKIA